jgi:hypothetical protein
MSVSTCKPTDGSQSTVVGDFSLASMGKAWMIGGGRRTYVEVLRRAEQLQRCPPAPLVTVE